MSDTWNRLDCFLCVSMLASFFFRMSGAETSMAITMYLSFTGVSVLTFWIRAFELFQVLYIIARPCSILSTLWMHFVLPIPSRLVSNVICFMLTCARQTHETVGPLLLSVIMMFTDIINWSLLLGLLFGGFFFSFSFVSGSEEEAAPGFGNTKDLLISLWNGVLGGLDVTVFEDLPSERRVRSLRQAYFKSF